MFTLSQPTTEHWGIWKSRKWKWKWKLETEWKCANCWRAVLHMRKVGIAQDTAYRVEMVLCAAIKEGSTIGLDAQPSARPTALQSSRLMGLDSVDDEGSFASSGSDFE